MKDSPITHTQPAFPIYDLEEKTIREGFAGLTKREYFAARALQGLLHEHSANFLYNAPQAEGKIKELASVANQLADALCDELFEQDLSDRSQ